MPSEKDCADLKSVYVQSKNMIPWCVQSTTGNKIDSGHIRDNKRLLPVWEAEILRATVKIIEVFSSFYVDF